MFLYTDGKELREISYISESSSTHNLFVCHNVKKVPVYLWKIVESQQLGRNEISAVTEQNPKTTTHPVRAWVDSNGKTHTLWKYKVQAVNLKFYVDSFRVAYKEPNIIIHNTVFLTKKLVEIMVQSKWVHRNITRENVLVTYDLTGRFTDVNIVNWENSTLGTLDQSCDIYSIGWLGVWVLTGSYKSGLIFKNHNDFFNYLGDMINEDYRKRPSYRELLLML